MSTPDSEPISYYLPKTEVVQATINELLRSSGVAQRVLKSLHAHRANNEINLPYYPDQINFGVIKRTDSVLGISDTALIVEYANPDPTSVHWLKRVETYFSANPGKSFGVEPEPNLHPNFPHVRPAAPLTPHQIAAINQALELQEAE